LDNADDKGVKIESLRPDVEDVPHHVGSNDKKRKLEQTSKTQNQISYKEYEEMSQLIALHLKKQV